jgi:hypothetical protein
LLLRYVLLLRYTILPDIEIHYHKKAMPKKRYTKAQWKKTKRKSVAKLVLASYGSAVKSSHI